MTIFRFVFYRDGIDPNTNFLVRLGVIDTLHLSLDFKRGEVEIFEEDSDKLGAYIKLIDGNYIVHSEISYFPHKLDSEAFKCFMKCFHGVKADVSAVCDMIDAIDNIIDISDSYIEPFVGSKFIDFMLIQDDFVVETLRINYE